jgi:hypothetical protein
MAVNGVVRWTSEWFRWAVGLTLAAVVFAVALILMKTQWNWF